MAPGDELSYSCTVANVMANFTNVATIVKASNYAQATAAGQMRTLQLNVRFRF